SGLVVLELDEVWSLERSRGEPWSLDVPREREELRPWARRCDFAVSLLESWPLMRSCDLLRSLLCPDAVESDEVELLALSWSDVDDVLSPFILLLSDLLSDEALEELGVELELVSWLCARAPEAASASARTDNA